MKNNPKYGYNPVDNTIMKYKSKEFVGKAIVGIVLGMMCFYVFYPEFGHFAALIALLVGFGISWM